MFNLHVDWYICNIMYLSKFSDAIAGMKRTIFKYMYLFRSLLGKHSLTTFRGL